MREAVHDARGKRRESLRVFDIVDEGLDCLGLVWYRHGLEVFLNERNHLGLAGVVGSRSELVNSLIFLKRLYIHVAEVYVLSFAQISMLKGQYYAFI